MSEVYGKVNDSTLTSSPFFQENFGARRGPAGMNYPRESSQQMIEDMQKKSEKFWYQTQKAQQQKLDYLADPLAELRNRVVNFELSTFAEDRPWKY